MISLYYLSCALIEGLGFEREGVLRKCVKGYQDVIYDDIVYSLLKEDNLIKL